MGGKAANLIRIDHIHNDSSLQHAGQARLDCEVGFGIAIRRGGAIGGEFSCHSAAREGFEVCLYLSMRREGEGGDKGEGREIYCPHDTYFKFSGARPADDISCAPQKICESAV